MDGEKLRQMVAENRNLEPQLTKRNEQYIFDLKKALKAANLSEEEITVALYEMLPKLVAGQKTGETARKQFGTVAERVEYILTKPKEHEENPAWQVWLDNAMLFFAMLTILNGLMSLIAKNNVKNPSTGLTSLVITSAVGGLIFYYMYKWIYQFEKPGADKSKRPKMWKSMGLLALGMLVWIFVYAGSAFLPSVINPILDPVILIVVGIITIGVRMWFKKKFDIRGTFFNR